MASHPIFDARNRIRRLILEMALDEIKGTLWEDITDHDPTDAELDRKVGAQILHQLQQATAGRSAEYDRITACIDDLANLCFDCSWRKLVDRKPGDFVRIPLYQRSNIPQPDPKPFLHNALRSSIAPAHYNVEATYKGDLSISIEHSWIDEISKAIPGLIETAQYNPRSPLVHDFEDWAHKRLLTHGEPRVKAWLKQLYDAKFGQLIPRIDRGRADIPGTPTYDRWQRMLKQEGVQGKRDWKYLLQVETVLQLQIVTD